MQFSFGFQVYPWLDKLLRIRNRHAQAYGIALLLVALAVLARWLVHDYVGDTTPFITFFPAIVLATLVCGLWPGVLAAVLSTVAAWYFFVPPFGSLEVKEPGFVHLALFLGVSALNVAVAALLNWLVDRLVAQQRNIRLLLDSAPNGIMLVDGAGRIRLANASMGQLFGYKPAELAGRPVDTLVPQDRVEAHRALRSEYQRKPEARLMGVGRDLAGRRKDGSEFAVEIGLNPVGDEERPAVLATVIDITARKRAEEGQRVLMEELQHRTQNIFGVIQSIIASSLKGVTDIPASVAALQARVQALSHAYLLAPTSSEGVPLPRLLERQLAPYSRQHTIEGCDVTLKPRAAEQFALIVHELATNAVKYGALSTPTGRVAIAGDLEETTARPTFVFAWLESGGPPVAPPQRSGFGSVILRRMAEGFAERVDMRYESEGFTYRLHVDLDDITAGAGADATVERARNA